MAKYRPTQAEVRDLVTWWAKRLNLQHWWIEVVFEGTPDGSLAETVFSGLKAQISFNLKSKEITSLDVLEHTVVHELSHVMFRQTHRTIRKLYSFAYGEDTDLGQNFTMEFKMNVEDLCDHMAKVLIGMKQEGN